MLSARKVVQVNANAIHRNFFALFFLLTVLTTSTTALAAPKPTLQAKQKVLTTGITSLARSGDGATIFAGTKDGRTLVSSGNLLEWDELPRKEEEPTTRYPVYSLASGFCNDCEGELIFAGAGDRFISVWQKKGGNGSFITSLGPHTGWVKDVVYCQETSTLFSIGCNCIESWDCGQVESISHVSKREIDNSPDMGSTLSSDLLSLCLIEGKGLLSGGVDGRIHLWSLDPLEIQPLSSSACHQGRVNAIVYSTTLDLAFSVGHDGRVVTSRLDANLVNLISDFEIAGTPRLSSISLLYEDATSCKLAVGTTDGQAILVSIDSGSRGSVKMTEECRLQIDDQPMVYSICNDIDSPGSERNDCFQCFPMLVGHAKGMIEVVASRTV